MFGVLNKNTRAYFFQLLFLSLVSLTVFSSLCYQIYGFKNAINLLIGGSFCLSLSLLLSSTQTMLLQFQLTALSSNKLKFLIFVFGQSFIYLLSLYLISNYLLIYLKINNLHIQNIISLVLGGLVVCFLMKILSFYAKDSFLIVRTYFLTQERFKMHENLLSQTFRETSLYTDFLSVTFLSLAFFAVARFLGISFFSIYFQIFLLFIFLLILFQLFKYMYDYLKNLQPSFNLAKLNKSLKTLEKLRSLFLNWDGFVKNVLAIIISYLYLIFVDKIIPGPTILDMNVLTLLTLGVLFLLLLLLTLMTTLKVKVKASLSNLSKAFKSSKKINISENFLIYNILDSNLYVPSAIFLFIFLSSFSIYLSLNINGLYIVAGVYLAFIFAFFSLFLVELYLKATRKKSKNKKITSEEEWIFLQNVRMYLFSSSLSNISYLVYLTNLFLYFFLLSSNK